MRKVLLSLFVLICTNLFAISEDLVNELAYETTYSKALIKAKKENKSIMMFIVQDSCPWCRKMEKQTLKKSNIASLIKRDFIPLIVDEASNNYPKKFQAKVFPTTYFINKNEEIVSKVLGYKNKKEFYYILKEASSK
ncbi:thioredoxin family protein [Halarcobacter sp.]|uniref:thioredoxin family protein n=1 Tax=Halarcobacter sp. TaxID=2321133 RepID=UPI002AA8A139|nr:thioredoxin family protein [Halarcobacter sp.]|eukprot:Anaeramoba_ignava/a92238_38.p5 GENE.a92238_38~~a92238_38.p5  ORF type:complete len:137 (-),score=28.18 a92238_38:1507-1917(-)